MSNLPRTTVLPPNVQLPQNCSTALPMPNLPKTAVLPFQCLTSQKLQYCPPNVQPPQKLQYCPPNVQPPQKLQYCPPNVQPPQKLQYCPPNVQPPQKLQYCPLNAQPPHNYWIALPMPNHPRSNVTCCYHVGHSFQLTARVLLYAPSHRQDSTYHSLCYTNLHRTGWSEK